MKLDYKGKSAIITGASGGMGLEISKKLSQNDLESNEGLKFSFIDYERIV